MNVRHEPILSDKSGICPAYGMFNSQAESCQACQIRVECGKARNPSILSYENFDHISGTAPDTRLEDFMYFDDEDENLKPIFSINDFSKLINFLFHLPPQQMNDLIGRLHRLPYSAIKNNDETRQACHKRCRVLAKEYPELTYILLSRKRRAE